MSLDFAAIKRAAHLDDVIARRGFTVTKDGKRLWMCCPFHEGDTTPSLCLEPTKLVWRCHGCSKGGSVIDLVMLLDGIDAVAAGKKLGAEYGVAEIAGDSAARPIATGTSKPRAKVGEWRYEDERGQLVTTIERWEPGLRGRDKDYVQRLPDGTAKKSARQILYRLADVLFADQVFVAEGEKAAEAAVSLGLVATTWAGGTSVVEELWTPDFAAPLRGKRVVLLPDDDDGGRKAMKHIAGVLAPLAKDVRVLDLKAKKPGKDKGGDIANWVDAGGSREKLLELAMNAPLANAPDADGKRDQLKLTDSGNAELFVKQHGDRLRWSSASGEWLVWDDRRWARDRLGEALRLTKETVRSLYKEVEDQPTSGDAVQLVKHIHASGKSQRRSAILTLAASEPGISVVPELLDANPWQLVVENGTVNLKTGELEPHRRTDLATKLAPVKYDEGASAPAFTAFINQILPDAEVRAFVQRFLGYALTGTIAEHVLPVFYGTGGNGKGTLMTTVQSVMGEYARQVPATLLMARKDEGHPTEKASLFGCRLAVASETKKNAALAEDTVKHLTGGDVISARFMRQDFFDFLPTHKIALQTNNKPRVTGTDMGIWRRIRLVPFEVSIPEEKADTGLTDKLKLERAGVLRWLIEGCLAWQANGLGKGGAVAEATAEYRRDQDTLGSFLEDCVSIEADQMVTSSELYAAYRKWAADKGERFIMSARGFGGEMSERDMVRGKLHGNAVYRGIRLSTGEQRNAQRGSKGGAGGANEPPPVSRPISEQLGFQTGGASDSPLSPPRMDFTPDPDEESEWGGTQ